MNDQDLNRYFDRVRAIAKLTREEEHELAVLAAAGDEDARQKMIEANLRYAVAIALKYRRYPIPLSEIVAEANIGLVTAARKFDPHRGTRFVTYAGYWIRAFVLDLIVRSARPVGGGSGALRSKVFFKLRRERARAQTLGLRGHEAIEEVARRMGEDASKVERLLNQLQARDVSFDEPLGDDARSSFGDAMASADLSPEEWSESRQEKIRLSRSVEAAVARLDERERFIVQQRLLNVDDQMTLASLGEALGVSRERARQLESRAKKKLREELSELVQ